MMLLVDAVIFDEHLRDILVIVFRDAVTCMLVPMTAEQVEMQTDW